MLRQLLWSTEHMSGEQRSASSAHDNRLACVFVEGDAGIGKTRLVEEINLLAESHAWTVLWSRATRQEKNTPYWLWVKLLRTILEEGLWFPPVEETDLAVFSPLVALLPELADFFPGPMRSRFGLIRQEPTLLQEALLALFSSISIDVPVLLVLDDLHWLDETSCEVLGLLAHRIASFPMLIVGTYRGTELVQQKGSSSLHALIASLQRDHPDSIMRLDRLSDTEIAALVSSHTGISQNRIQHITQLAAGNPFFAEELARSPSSALSRTINAALETRILQLSPACQQFLSYTSVLGETFTLPMLVAMEADSSEDMVFELLDEALKAKILVEEGKGSHIHYHFWHSLLTHHLYERLSRTRRAKLHQRAAGALQQVYAQREEWAATIVYHLVAAGGEPQATLHYALLAADRAYALSAYSEAAHHYRLALTTLDEAKYQQNDLRLVPHEDLWFSAAALSERLAECCAVQGEFAAARRLYEDVLHQWTRKRDETREQFQAQMEALLWCEIGWTWYDEGVLVHARQCCEQGFRLLLETGSMNGTAHARLRFHRASISWREGNYTAALHDGNIALEVLEAALAQSSSQQERRIRSTRISRTLAGNPVDLGRVHALLGPFAKAVGQTDEALVHLHAALAIFEEHQCSREIAHVCCNIADVYMQRKEYILAQTSLQRARQFAEGMGDVALNAAIVGNLGIISMDEGNMVEAERYLTQSVELAERIHDTLFVSIWFVYLADVYAAQKEFAAALGAVRRAFVLGRTMKNIPCIGHALVTLGTIRIAQAVALSKPNTKSLLPSLGYIRLLKRARSTLHRALTYEELEEDFRIKGEQAMAQVIQLLPP